jgi:hypothetical protein
MHHSTARLTRVAAAALLALAAGACSRTPSGTDNDSTGTPAGNNQGIVAGTLEVKAARPTLTLRNTTEFVVGYMIVDKDQAVIALYPPCAADCPNLVQGATTTVAYSAIGGYTSKSTEATVMWWTYRRNADGTLRAEGAINTMHVKL